MPESNHKGKATYFIPKESLSGSCYFEFQPGKYNVGKHWFSKMGATKLDGSLYLYGDDDGLFDYSAIAPFTYLIAGSHPDSNAAKSFDYCGITFIDENDGAVLIKSLREFAALLGEGRQIYESLSLMKLYDPGKDGSWREENGIEKLDLIILKNTAEGLADWIEKAITKYKWVSVLGI
ncbi:MAG: hypothetical protein FWD58_11190 [Firmicutes bacterium]|nr:hypothetical protein [Bacillota bacterium]